MRMLPKDAARMHGPIVGLPLLLANGIGQEADRLARSLALNHPKMASVQGKLMRGEKSSVSAAYLGRDDRWWCGLQTASRIAGRMAASEEANNENDRWVGERVVWVR